MRRKRRRHLDVARGDLASSLQHARALLDHPALRAFDDQIAVRAQTDVARALYRNPDLRCIGMGRQREIVLDPVIATVKDRIDSRVKIPHPNAWELSERARQPRADVSCRSGWSHWFQPRAC